MVAKSGNYAVCFTTMVVAVVVRSFHEHVSFHAWLASLLGQSAGGRSMPVISPLRNEFHLISFHHVKFLSDMLFFLVFSYAAAVDWLAKQSDTLWLLKTVCSLQYCMMWVKCRAIDRVNKPFCQVIVSGVNDL